MADLSADRVRAIESLVTDWLWDEDVPGASLVVVDPDGERYASGFGARDLESNAPATPDTLYGAGSISKSFTATAMAQLEAAGELSLSDPVDDYVDHFVEAPGDPITIAELLSHTSGMPAADPGVLMQAIDGPPAGVADDEDFERFVRASSGWRVTDRERFMYYNSGYDALGSVVEAVDGRRYATYVREEVLEPLGMERSTFDPGPFEEAEDAMTGYAPGEEGPEQAPFPFDELIHPAGGLVASPRELGRFLRAAMNDGELAGTRILPDGEFDRLQRGRAVRQTYLDGRDQEYGFGWMADPIAGDRAVGHGGSIVVSTAYAGYLEDAELGVAVACNTTVEPHPMDLGAAVLAVATGHDRTAVPAFAIRAKCEAVTGTYESFRGDMTVDVEPDDGGVSLSFSEAPIDGDMTAYPTSLDPDDHEFELVNQAGARESVEFRPDGDRADLFFQRHRFRRTEPGA